MKAVVAAFNQEKALVEAFSVITNLRMQLFEALVTTSHSLTSDVSHLALTAATSYFYMQVSRVTHTSIARYTDSLDVTITRRLFRYILNWHVSRGCFPPR